MRLPEDVAREAIEGCLKWYPTDIFGDDITGKDWQAIRDVSPVSTERIGATCYRHAYRVALEVVGRAFTEWYEDEDSVDRATPDPDTLAKVIGQAFADHTGYLMSPVSARAYAVALLADTHINITLRGSDD